VSQPEDQDLGQKQASESLLDATQAMMDEREQDPEAFARQKAKDEEKRLLLQVSWVVCCR